MEKFLKQMFFSLGVMLILFTGCKHNPDNSVTLTGITLDTTNVKKEFTVGDEFTTEGLVVTASYSDETTKAVTDWTASGDDLSKASENQTIIISYTEDGETANATYTIVIREKEFPPAVKYELTYETQFGSVPSKKVEKGYKLTSADLPSLTQTGYVFEGWNKKAGDEITADTKITANWKKIDSAFAISLDSGSELKFNVTVNDKNLIFEVPGEYTKYEWYVDGALDGDVTTNEYVLNTTLPYDPNARMEMPKYKYLNGKHEILVIVTAADGSKDSARATFVIFNE